MFHSVTTPHIWVSRVSIEFLFVMYIYGFLSNRVFTDSLNIDTIEETLTCIFFFYFQQNSSNFVERFDRGMKERLQCYSDMIGDSGRSNQVPCCILAVLF